MKERFNIQPQAELIQGSESESVYQAHEKVTELVSQELFRRHAHKIFHNPRHTLGDGVVENLTSVRGGVLQLSKFVEKAFAESLNGREHTFELIKKGVEIGAIAHDVIMEIDGLAPNGMIQRRRGWQEGGNERESFRFFRREFLKEYVGSEEDFAPEEEELVHSLLVDRQSPDFDPDYLQYVTSAERVISGTEPDKMNFSYLIDAQYLSGYSDDVLECLVSQQHTRENPDYRCLSIDSSKAHLSLEGLLGSTADLGVFSDPEAFIKTGNAEFWELQYQFSKDCANFLENPDALHRERMVAIVSAMSAWRRMQVGVVVGQKLRIAENFVPERIASLYKDAFGVAPHDTEVEEFITLVQDAVANSNDTVQQCAETYRDFTGKFSPLLAAGGEKLSMEEKTLFAEAIAYMDADEKLLRNYVHHVDEELEKTAKT